ncbi:MAG: NUDIX domain-containing protein [Ignavibacteria bacterium]|nr:NUDIX domain-containing protein [Ignavibacteria bacterium]MBT8382122.1 NUDIX domain-containing protein [Ignavibacteria bacterium]MBT8392590.1 NUDIX domain-containing protein [Ignavibacteria bacterium]NNJ53814.1 NUDIX domain-containing protein [Ignavibacteriaceae bacterium]NNL21344.1 NUDIX domain-containing protein [Ignavibacteriaceae bacterium]
MKIISTMIEAHIFRETKIGIEFLSMKRANNQFYPDLWQMVTGKIKTGEKAYEAALREIKEETGLIPAQLWVAPTINSFYEPRDEYICLLPVFAAKVDSKSEITISDEHTEFKWLKSKDAKELLAWPGQREAVDIIEDYFINKKSFLHFVEIKF